LLVRIQVLRCDGIAARATQSSGDNLVNLVECGERLLLTSPVPYGPIGLSQPPPGYLIVRPQLYSSLE
jgi:hypothetical protein